MGIGRKITSGLVAVLLPALLFVALPMDAQAQNYVWMRTYNGAANGADVGWGVALAADGSVYVAGSTTVGQQSDMLLRKYSAAGALMWSRTYNGPLSSSDSGRGVGVAADGSVYVAGQTGGDQADVFLRKYSAAGAVIWTKIYTGVANGYDAGTGVTVAADGSVYVTGCTQIPGGWYFGLLLQKYSPAGALIWTRTYNGTTKSFHFGEGVAAATDGSVYVAGQTDAGVQMTNLFLRKYSAAGGVLWTKTYNGMSGGLSALDWGSGVAVAADGSVYVAGTSVVMSEEANVLLQKYSAAGARLWTKTYNGPNNAEDEGESVAVAPDGSVYVVGFTNTIGSGQSANLLLQKYSAAGALVSTKTFNGVANGDDRGLGVAVAKDGSVYVTGYTHVDGQESNMFLRKYR